MCYEMVRDLHRYYSYSEVFQSLLVTKNNKTLKHYKSIRSHVGCSSLTTAFSFSLKKRTH